MESAAFDPENMPTRDMLMLRLTLLAGGALIALFMIGDLKLLPGELSEVYFHNRVFIQLPTVGSLLAFTFYPRFLQFAQPAFLLGILSVTYANYYLIHVSWEREAFSFPYEGTLMYAFFGFFVLGLTFRYALWLMVLSSLGFIALVLQGAIYGDRTVINVGFVVGSLFIGVVGRRQLDRMIGKFKEANAQLLTLSNVDPLTDLLNRRALMKESTRLFELKRRSTQPLTVFMMDLDYFKQFNDRYGHQEGDRAIRCHADIMRQVFKRQTDILGRYGGEEFIAITASQSADQSRRQAAEVVARWQKLAMPNEDSPGGKYLTCSIGICCGLAADFDSLDEMIHTADQALYSAKNNSRAMFVMAEQGRTPYYWETGETLAVVEETVIGG